MLAATMLAFRASEWPDEADFIDTRATYAVELGLKAVSLNAQQARNKEDELQARRALEDEAVAVRTRNYNDISSTDLIAKLRPILKDIPYQEQLAQREIMDAREVSKRRREIVLFGIFAWLGTTSSLYFVGWGIAWVRNGFRNEAKHSLNLTRYGLQHMPPCAALLKR